MRLGLLVLFVFPSAATAQSQSQPQGQSTPTPLQRPMETTLPSPLDTAPVPLAGKDGNRILSKNEAYNLGRAFEGRVGVRLGNDMSFRITDN